MRAQAGSAEVDALAVALAQRPFQGVAVRPLQRETVLPQRSLRSADGVGTFIAGAVVAGLRDEPGHFEAGLAA